MTTSPTQLLAHVLADVDSDTCDAYASSIPQLVAYTTRRLAPHEAESDQLQLSLFSRRASKHAEYAELLHTHLKHKNAYSLIEAFVWIYRADLLNGTPLHHFPINIDTWCAAVDRYLPSASAAKIKRFYQCLGSLHSWLTLLAHTPHDRPQVDEQLAPYFHRYVAALLKPDMAGAVAITSEFVKTPAELQIWWEQIIQPAMYEVGNRWARGEITVGQEHLATAITQRVMAIYYPMILDLPRQKGAIVVAASPGELHEIGARIVADLLEVHGWDVYCTGANTPTTSVIELVSQTNAQFLCISTTLVSSLSAVSTLIDQVRGASRSATPQILVGGQAYMTDPTLWRRVGADTFAYTARAGIDYIEAHQQR